MAASTSASHGISISGSHTIDAVIDLMGGSFGGAACVFVGQPLDTVKVKMQTFPKLYSNALTCFVQTFAKEGFFRGLYAGTVPSLVANIAENAVIFAAYGGCQKVIQIALNKSKIDDLSAFDNACAGFMAAFFSSLTLCPTELIKCRLQALQEISSMKGEARPTIGPMTLTRTILKTEGIRGLYHGLMPTFVREMPGYFFFFGGYELTRSLFTPPGKKKEDIGLLRTVVSGGVGGTCLWTIIFPFDVLKSRIQIAGNSEGMLKLLLKIARTEGVGSLYNGLGPTLLRTFPASGALFVVYELSKNGMHQVVADVMNQHPSST
ncbi:hypothetical protein CHUAL_003057 [Chamberlinius hualienensis]